MRKANPNTHQDCRSLLQKAVRRGNQTLVAKVVDHLYEIDDIKWLKQRVGVITVEECWPLIGEWELPKKLEEQQAAIRDMLSRAAMCAKFKDATGLGSLAYALSEGDDSVLTNSDEDADIKHVSAAIQREKEYWEWIISQCSSDSTNRLVKRASVAYRRGGWPWDKAFIQAAAYLAVTDGLPKLPDRSKTESKFPFWVALDKHTPQGKAALSKAAKETGFPWRQLNWVSFYCESGRVDNLMPSRWWDREVKWRLGKVGLSLDEAESMWTKARPVFTELLQEESKHLEQHIGISNSQPNNTIDGEQLSLFSLYEGTKA